MKVHRKDKEVDIDEAIAEVLRHAPHRPGGSKYKVCLFVSNLDGNFRYRASCLCENIR